MGNLLQNITSVSPCDLTPAGDFTLPYSDTPIQSKLSQLRPAIAHILQRALEGKMLNHEEAEALFYCYGPETDALLHTADIVRELRTGNDGSFVITRNINFTNVCHMGCQFCNFGVNKNAGDAEFLAPHQVAARAKEAHARGATEICVQGGLHPDLPASFYGDLLDTVSSTVPDVHIHAYSPFEIWYGAMKGRKSYTDLLTDLKQRGLASMPGTAAEILDTEVRRKLTKNKLSTENWLKIIETAHNVGLPTTSTIMYGHIDGPSHWAAHLILLRDMQARTGGFTEFVPLGFIHNDSPLYKNNPSEVRTGPTADEHFKMHAIARLVLQGYIDNIQASWVKMGPDMASKVLRAGANDLGGTLMNESISRAAGASHGQEIVPRDMVNFIQRAGLSAHQRNTLYDVITPYGRDKKPAHQAALVGSETASPAAPQKDKTVFSPFNTSSHIPVKVSA